MLKNFVKLFGGDPTKRTLDKTASLVDQINDLEPEFEALSDEALRQKTSEFRTRLAEPLDGIGEADQRKKAEREALEEILPEAFAAVREASKRTNGQRHYDVQLIGGITLHQGKIAEMRTGEGKTLVATLPLYLNALAVRGAHLITVNDYLARRDARWMAPIYNALGLSVGVLQMAARTENGKKAFVVDLDRHSPHEDQDQLRIVSRVEAYAADITYGTNSEFGFDYLRDNMTMGLAERVQRGGRPQATHYYAIVDEVDNVLIDEARTPLIISGPAAEAADWYYRMAQVVRQLKPEHYEIDERDRTVTLTELGETQVETLLNIPLSDPDRPEDATPEQERLMGYLEQAMRAQFLFKRNKDYIVQGSKVIIVDEFTGRMMPGRRWSDGLHQAVEAKEGVRVQSEDVTYATITIQNYFRMYDKLAGMSGTALTEAEEFDKIYKLEVSSIPTNLEYQAMRKGATLLEEEDRDAEGYKYRYYTVQDDPDKKPVFWRRKDYPDVIYRTEEAKFRAITGEILSYYAQGRPMLVGTTSVELSERLSTRLRADPLKRMAQAMLIRSVWMEKNNRAEEGRVIDELQFLNKPLDQMQQPDVDKMRKMVRELGISFNPEDPENVVRLLTLMGVPGSENEKSRLSAAMQSGIPHQVLNARKHDEESQIIAKAGEFGSVTIATNMAGRGVDIKLGGELAEEHIAIINRVLKRAGNADPYNMTMEQRRQAIQSLDPGSFGIYEAEVQYFLKHMEDMESVKRLGGLHIIGSERHEARRIDNQLRGRAARQGDPGSSRFYLSLEDDLMRRFGGQQADNLMQRFKVDDAIPMEYGIVSRIIEQSQTRVEGMNFDIRKHLLEYDDVLNTQRAAVYSQRDRIFTKDDLSEDVTDMLRTEVQRRIPEALEDKEGPWKLISWLDQVQPPLNLGAEMFPSFALKLLLDHIDGGHEALAPADALAALQEVASDALQAEEDHLVGMVNILLEQAQDRLETVLKERYEALDTFFEGLSLEEGEEGATPGKSTIRNPRQIAEELAGVLHLPVRLSPEQQRSLREDPKQVVQELRGQVETGVVTQSVTRLIGSVERRLEDELSLGGGDLPIGDWDAIVTLILDALQKAFTRRRERYLGEDGAITKDIQAALDRINGPVDRRMLLGLLLLIPQGAKAAFDKRTHRRVFQRTTRLTYVYSSARYLEERETQEIADEVLAHLEEAQTAMQRAWGEYEWERLATLRPVDLDETIRRGLTIALGENNDESLPLASLSGEARQTALMDLGRQALTEVYRQLLLNVITELWVDYLTQMEALRVSIGLEAYAQRDPLVQYKSRASEMYHELVANMRLGVISRMFTYRPRSTPQAAISAPRSAAALQEGDGSGGQKSPDQREAEQAEAGLPDEVEELTETDAETSGPDVGGPATPSGKSKRRRRRH
jgi:preprotein translocase subunit SecA